MENAYMSPGPKDPEREFASPPSAAWHDRLFAGILPLVVGSFIALGLHMNTISPRIERVVAKARQMRTQFIVTRPEPKKIAPPKPVQRPPKTAVAEKPLDLTDKPILAQKTDEKAPPQPVSKKKVRRVYGLRKVYSRGIGEGGSLADAVIGKQGNTLNTALDTLTATEDDIKGRLVSTSTVTRGPKYKKRAKPEYTPDMLDNKIEGVVKIRALIDVDGKVKKALALNDLGFDAANQALKATLEMEFEPAMREEEPVAVWIVIPIRFVMLG
ncbi:MAG: TonB family protein [Chitinivibrionales bacterium]|nr:TonB family protein [Chitinivibrionales bacterium]MBD3358615.1 TonB family protein [Chitinivibrionales bacterium]